MTKQARQLIARETWKFTHPSSRIVSTFRFGATTGTRKQRECVLCTATCPGWSTAYPRTKRSITWEDEHDCSVEFLATRGFTGAKLDNAIKLAERAPDPISLAILGDMIKMLAHPEVAPSVASPLTTWVSRFFGVEVA